jgi:hypothetical protein
MSIATAVKTVMIHRLERLGYPTSDIRWDLGYSQGDGASFTGSLNNKLLGVRLLPDINPSVWDSVDYDLELTRSGRYVHERSTSLNYDLECVACTESNEFGGAAQKVAMGRFLAVLEDDIISAGSDIAADGYKVIESFVREKELVRAFRTKNFVVEVFMVPDEFADPFESCDESFREETIRQVLAEEIYIGAVEVVIKQVFDDGETSNELGFAHCGGTEWGRSESVFKTGLVRDLTREAVLEAREKFAQLSRPKLKKAA